MLVTIQNESLTVKIDSTGAEPASIRDTAGTEYLWQGDPEIWGRRAPLLFPIIARLKDGQYRPRVTVDFADFPYLGVWTAPKDFDTNAVSSLRTSTDPAVSRRDLFPY